MVLAFDARESTRDVDAINVAPGLAATVREFAQVVARERGWPEDWLNDGAKGYLIGLSSGPVVFTAAGIDVWSPATAQVLAMKLSAWRDDVDISDARHLLKVMSGNRQEVWEALEPYLVPGEELKAQYAFRDLWESMYGEN